MMLGMKGRLRAAMKVTCCAAVLVLAACSDGEETGAPEEAPEEALDGGSAVAPEVAERVENALPLAGAGGEEGEGENYEVTGTLVADSGFRPTVDGFSFPNYGNEEDPQNLTPANVEALFGEQVCVAGTGADCVLTPAGQHWMESNNEIMNGGHCMGFSVASLRMFADTLDPEAFGAKIPNELPFENPDLQATLAESFVYQSIPQIIDETFYGTPAETVEAAIEVLNAGEEYYTLGFYKRDGSGGHAVTPIAVEDKGDGQYAILVYDNNYPNTLRAFDIDTNANTFSYNGSPNPDIAEDLYEGDETTTPLELIPTLIGEQIQPCPFCDGDLLEEGADESLGSVLPAEEQYAEVTLVGDIQNHPHLVFTDDQDRQTGIIDGKLVEDIPGVKIVRQYAQDPSGGVPEPRFQIPIGQDVIITIDGSHLESTAEGVSVSYTGDGKVLEIEDITIAPGQQDSMYVTAEDYIVVYETNNEDGVAPSFFAGVDEQDASYTLGATVVGVAPGSLLGLAILQEEGQVLFDMSDATASEGDEAIAILAVSKLDESGEHTWIDDSIAIDTSAQEDVYLNYKAQDLVDGESIDIEIGPEDGPYRIEEALFAEA